MNLDLVIVIKTEKLEQNKSKKITKLKLLNKNFFNKFLYHAAKFDFKNIFIFFDKNSVEVDNKYDGKILNFIKIKCYKINELSGPIKIITQISEKIKNDSIVINSNFIQNFKTKNLFSKKIDRVKKPKFHKDGFLILPKSNSYIISKNKRKLEKVLVSRNYELNFISKKIIKKNIKLKKAIFLDRDGVINYDFGYVYEWSKFKFRPGVIKGLKYIVKNKYLLFIITNQSGIGRGYFSEDQFHSLQKKLKQFLSKKKIFIDDIQYSPYHPKAKIKKFKRNSKLRKPGNLMIKNIFKIFDVDINKSFMIGDRQSDKIAASKSKLKFFYTKGNFYSQVKEINMSLKK